MTAITALLPDGRLHLQHGPIDCLCQAWGSLNEIQAAYRQAANYFATVLEDLCAELPLLRTPVGASPPVATPPPAGAPPASRIAWIAANDPEAAQLVPIQTAAHKSASTPLAEDAPPPAGKVAQAMYAACAPFSDGFITPMAAVAGAVADAVLTAMTQRRDLDRAFVNNGGDIAFHLAPGASLRCGLVTDLTAQLAPSDRTAPPHPEADLDGTFLLTSAAPARGLATSGRACKGQGGRSFSFGIADSVTILARTAAQADAAATIVGNAVDLHGHPSIDRRPATQIDPSSDLGDRLITFDVGPLTQDAIRAALNAGATTANTLLQQGLIEAAVLALRGHIRLCQRQERP